MADNPLDLYAVLREEYVRLHGAPPADETGTDEEKLKRLFAAIHALPQPRSALCISGGGIRSATFALGVIQRLAAVGVLPKFDFVSTVSGGGYIGSWLSSYARRNADGMTGVASELTGNSATTNPLEPEVKPLMWLRKFSNYLTPRLGLTSGDTWAFAGSYIRNTLLVWLMLMPLLIATLAVPRLSIALLHAQRNNPTPFIYVAAAMMLIATLVLACTRPVSCKARGALTNGGFILGVFTPFFIGSIALALYWADLKDRNIDWRLVLVALAGISTLSSVVYMFRFIAVTHDERVGNIRHDSNKSRYVVKKFLFEIIAAAVSGGVATGLLYAATTVFHDVDKRVTLPQLSAWQTIPPTLSTAPGEFFLCFAVPVILAALFVQSAIFVGGASWYNEEYDREWWGRAAGWVLIGALVWIVFTAIVIYGPVVIFQLPATFTAIGGATGLVSILGGRSSKTAATDDANGDKAKPSSTLTNIALALAAPVFVIAIAALLSLGTSEVQLKLRDERGIDAGPMALAQQTWRVIEQDTTIYEGNEHYAAKLRSGNIPAVDTAKVQALRHLWVVDETRVSEGLMLVFGFALFGIFVSFFIGVNQFSMHALYRNRLVRAYLGASRFSRTPNAFSGFDPNDNLPMHRLRPEMLWANSFIDIPGLGPLLKANATIAAFVTDPTWKAIDDIKGAPTPNEHERLCLQAGDLLAHDLNHAIDQGTFGAAGTEPLAVRNRAALESLFTKHIRPMSAHTRPMHVVNMTLNLTATDNLAWQERKATSFVASPLNAGAWRLGFRPTREYGGPTGISLGTAVAISGAAASPNMGYHSSPPLSFLLTLFNVRLGWWLGNPKSSTYVNRNPTNSLVPFLAETFGYTNDTFPYVYLSDGGHFENLAIYEMVLRRCACIVVTDAGGDPNFTFDDLGNAIRKIRIDFGIDITIDKMAMFPRDETNPPEPPKYCAIATIHYERVDPNAKPGRLLYIKPAFYGKHESKDVYNYAQTSQSFPHETTGDQWFSESQFESYRQLGYWTLKHVTRDRDHFNSICDLIDEANKYVDDETALGGAKEVTIAPA